MRTTSLLGFLLLTAGCSTLDAINPFTTSETSPGENADQNAAIVDDAQLATGDTKVEASTPSSSEAAVLSAASSISPRAKQGPGVELIWQVPGEPVERYLIDYGLAHDKLDGHVQVSVTALEKYDDPAYGPVFRFLLPEVSAAAPIFVSIRAENKFGVSGPSQVERIEPQL